MTSFIRAPRCALLLGLGLLAALSAPAKTRYLHATAGNIDIVSSMSEERTTRFLHELIGIRLIVEDLLGTPVTQPATQVIVFGSKEEMAEFFPRYNLGGPRQGVTFSRIWHTAASPEGELFAVVDLRPNDQMFRQGAYWKYASRLISRSLPDCPTWIYEGLAAFLGTLEYHDGKLRLGEPLLDRKDIRLIYADRIPLADSLAREALSKDLIQLWHLWLTQDYAGNRLRIRQLAERMRHGARGNAETVSAVFGQPINQIQDALYSHMKRLRNMPIDIPAPTRELLANVSYSPATELDLGVARGLLFLLLESRPADFKATVETLAQAHPESPRPLEVLARLASAANDTATANEYWQRAGALHSTNAYAYLALLRQALEPRSTVINLYPSLTPQKAAELRAISDTAVGANPGLVEGYFWQAWTEAFAPEPLAERLTAVEQTHTRYLRPTVLIPLAIAHIRLRQFEEAKVLLDEYEKNPLADPKNAPAIAFLRKRIAALTAATP
jgi:hypothetical protein